MPKERGIDIFRNILKYNYEKAVRETNPKIIAVNSDRFPAKLEKIKKIIPSFELKIVPNTDHFLMLENPIEFNNKLNEAIKELLKTN
jgi:pimeloyl-ACP methyl ester carboxylesterase